MEQITPRPVITMGAVESSQIHSIGHCAKTNTLAIQFKNWKGELGSTYHYANFTGDDFAVFKAAESTGSYFGKHIKSAVEKHPFVKVG